MLQAQWNPYTPLRHPNFRDHQAKAPNKMNMVKFNEQSLLHEEAPARMRQPVRRLTGHKRPTPRCAGSFPDMALAAVSLDPLLLGQTCTVEVPGDRAGLAPKTPAMRHTYGRGPCCPRPVVPASPVTGAGAQDTALVGQAPRGPSPVSAAIGHGPLLLSRGRDPSGPAKTIRRRQQNGAPLPELPTPRVRAYVAVGPGPLPPRLRPRR